MNQSDTVAKEFFRLISQVRRLEREQSTTDGMLTLVQVAIASVNQENRTDTLSALHGLKKCIEAARPLLDDIGEREQKAAEDYVVLRKQNLELQLAIAELQRQDEAAAEIRQWINQMDGFFSAAVSALDPDRK